MEVEGDEGSVSGHLDPVETRTPGQDPTGPAAGPANEGVTGVPRKRNRCGAARRRVKRERGTAQTGQSAGPPNPPERSQGAGSAQGQADRKRRVGSGSTPPSVGKVTKRSRARETEHYAAVADPLARAIVLEGYPEKGITPEQLSLLQSCMATKIRGIKDGPLPRFVGRVALRNGAIIIRCADEASRSWLEGSAGDISPWEEARLRVVGLEELQRRHRAVVWVPGSSPAPAADVLELLERQNPGIGARDWRVYAENTGASPEGRNYVFGILESGVRRLRAKDFKLSHGIDEITVKVIRSRGEGGKEEPNPKA